MYVTHKNKAFIHYTLYISGTSLSGLTVSTDVSSPRPSISGASTISNDLLEVVVEPGANKQHANSSPPPPYQEVATETLRDNSTSQSNEWEDMTNTDDEFEEDELSEADNGKVIYHIN